MTNESQSVCPKCGQGVAASPQASYQPKEPREYDHRGILMPRRTRVGGIITPQ